MSKRQLELSTEGFRQRAIAWAWNVLIFTMLAVLLAILAWVGAPHAARRITVLPMIALHAGLAIVLQRGLAPFPLHRRWSYRMGFLASAGLAGLRWLSLALGATAGMNMVWLAALPAGAFLGGLVATGLDESLWENNSPPSERIQAEVYQVHQQQFSPPLASLRSKRIFDLTAALLGLLLSAPIWLLSAFLVWFEDPGPLLFVKNSVGKDGKNFRQFKFRTMVSGAEDGTGPILARERDERVLWVGRLLRKTALDELPQLLNILLGEMSFVGPRPQRTVLVHTYLSHMPEYAERHRVLPGLAGLAQVAGDYYLTPRQKLRFDRIYIRHAGLGFDLKLILLAFLITFWYRWQPGWVGRLPRRLLHRKAPQRSI